MDAVHVWIADTVGDGTGTQNSAADYSSTATKFKVRAETETNTHIEVWRLIVTVVDDAAPAAGGWGGILPTAALTNGITIGLYDADDTLSVDLTDGLPIKTNADWSRLAYDTEIDAFGTGNKTVKCRWTFSKFGGPIILSDGEYIAAVLNDDFSDLVAQYFTFEGTGTRG